MGVRLISNRAHWVPKYGLAALAAVAALSVHMSLEPVLMGRSPLMLAALAIMVSAWHGGLGPGLFCTAISLGEWLLNAGAFGRSLSVGDMGSYVQLAIFLIVGVGISVLAESLHHMSRHSDANSEKVALLSSHLERHVRELEKKQQELRKAVAEAEAANRAKDHFLAMISHELRTPLTPVLICAETLVRNPLLPQHAREEARLIHESAALETRLIDDLLDVTRISHGKLELKKRPMDVHARLRMALAMCQEETRRKRFSMTVDLLAERPCIEGDVERMQQVVSNVLRNAIKFTPEGGSITIRTYNRAGVGENAEPRLIVEISDSGIGIEPDVLPRLFKAFEQGDPSIRKHFGGLGLGLSICRMLVEAQGGTIWASSPGKGKGATFTIELPTTRLPAEEEPEPVPLPHPIEAQAVDRKLRILLVEDHLQTNVVLSKLLGVLGHDVRAAMDGVKARELAESEDFDLVISDLGLPDGSGLDLMRDLKSRYGLRGIALTGYGGDEQIQQSLEAGFAQHLVKPVTVHQLEAAIARFDEKPPMS